MTATAFYYIIGVILLGTGAWFSSMTVIMIGFYFYANTELGRLFAEMDNWKDWYYMFIVVHIAYIILLVANNNIWLNISAVGFALGVLHLALVLKGSGAGHRLFAHIDIAICSIILAPLPFYLASKIS